mgnify:FL=1
MAALFRKIGDHDRRKAAETIDGFMAAFDGKTRIDQAINDLVAGLRDATLDRDCDGDLDLQVIVLNGRHFTEEIIDWPYARGTDEAALETEIEETRSTFSIRQRHLADVLQHIGHTVKLADPTVERSIPEPAKMPDSAPAGLRERIEALVAEQHARGVRTDDGDGWPQPHPSNVKFLRDVFSATRDAILAAADLAPHFSRRSLQQVLVIWPRLAPGEPKPGRAEMLMANAAFRQVANALARQAEHLDNLCSLKETMRRNREERERIEAEKDAIRAELAQIPGLTNGLSEPAASRVRVWLDKGKPFSVTPSRVVTSPGAAAAREIRDWLGEEHADAARAALYGIGEKGLDGMRQLATRMRELAPEPRPEP